jgi:NADH dehydrogenase FAD-containing subunit
VTNNHLNVTTTEGATLEDVWAIGDAASVEENSLPATAQGKAELLKYIFLQFNTCQWRTKRLSTCGKS